VDEIDGEDAVEIERAPALEAAVDARG